MGLQRPKLSDVLYVEIGKQIKTGALRHDERLPTENELCQRYGVSRPIVRDALKQLRQEGYIYSRQGAGSFVRRDVSIQAEQQVAGLPPVESIADVRQFYDFRIALESETAALAALHRTDEELGEIGAALASIEEAIHTGEIGVSQDNAFHAALARASHNQYFVAALGSIQEHLAFTIDLARSFSIRRSVEHLAMVQNEHRAIFEAITDKDADAARSATRLHISNARARVFEGL